VGKVIYFYFQCGCHGILYQNSAKNGIRGKKPPTPETNLVAGPVSQVFSRRRGISGKFFIKSRWNMPYLASQECKPLTTIWMHFSKMMGKIEYCEQFQGKWNIFGRNPLFFLQPALTTKDSVWNNLFPIDFF
jgi:hypothetical protein